MRVKPFTWFVFFVLVTLSVTVWFKYSYPGLSFTNFSIDRTRAFDIAENYLQKRDVDTSTFHHATVFVSENKASQYLQKTIGFKRLKQFVNAHEFDMFFWIVRFFKEQEEEEYRLTVSSATGEVTGFVHVVDSGWQAETISKDSAQQIAQSFLKETFSTDFHNYSYHSDATRPYDNRTEYFFSWQKNGVSIPWSNGKDSGIGKLITSVRITGNNILSFSKNTFLVPDQFNRYLSEESEVGGNIASIITTIYMILFASSVFFIIVRRNHLAMHVTKNFYIGVMILSFVLSLVSHLNHLQDILFNYKTTSSFDSYFWRLGIDAVRNALFATVAVLMPSLSGELLHYEVLKDRKEGSFLYYIQSTFFSRHVTEMICLGYFVFLGMLGLQAVMVRLGEQYLGVWVEHTWIENLSAAYFPSLATFSWGYKTSIFEEIMYRLFTISLGVKIFNSVAPKGGMKNLFAAVICSSIIWGFAHSGYPVFPMWFRGIEITALGIFLSLIYINFGIIPVIIGHYLFNVFWRCAEHLLGTTLPVYFYSSLAVLLLPFGIGLIAFWINKEHIPRPMRWRLNNHQKYNLEILKTFLREKGESFKNQPYDESLNEISSHGWDPAVVDIALKEYLANASLKAPNDPPEGL